MRPRDEGQGKDLRAEGGPRASQVQRDGEERDALFTLGAYLALQGQYEEALEVLNQLSKLDLEYPGLWWVKARVFQQMGKREAA